jgi:hypothetical protein
MTFVDEIICRLFKVFSFAAERAVFPMFITGTR